MQFQGEVNHWSVGRSQTSEGGRAMAWRSINEYLIIFWCVQLILTNTFRFVWFRCDSKKVPSFPHSADSAIFLTSIRLYFNLSAVSRTKCIHPSASRHIAAGKRQSWVTWPTAWHNLHSRRMCSVHLISSFWLILLESSVCVEWFGVSLNEIVFFTEFSSIRLRFIFRLNGIVDQKSFISSARQQRDHLIWDWDQAQHGIAQSAAAVPYLVMFLRHFRNGNGNEWILFMKLTYKFTFADLSVSTWICVYCN